MTFVKLLDNATSFEIGERNRGNQRAVSSSVEVLTGRSFAEVENLDSCSSRNAHGIRAGSWNYGSSAPRVDRVVTSTAGHVAARACHDGVRAVERSDAHVRLSDRNRIRSVGKHLFGETSLRATIIGRWIASTRCPRIIRTARSSVAPRSGRSSGARRRSPAVVHANPGVGPRSSDTGFVSDLSAPTAEWERFAFVRDRVILNPVAAHVRL